MKKLLILSFTVVGLIPQLFSAPKAIRFGTLIDGTGRVSKNAVVIVDKDRIQALLGADAAIPAVTEVVDLSRYTGIPGLIDVHTHVTYGPRPGSRTASPVSAVINMYLGQDALRKTLESGVTTIRDMNASEYVDVAMRDLINMGAMVGPRMFVVGYGLHPTRSPFRLGSAAPPGGTADGPDEVMRAVRQQIAAGVDWIKMFASTGTGQDVTGFQTYTFEEMKAAVDVAHGWGKRIAIHCYGPECARDAIRAGCDSLEHPVDMDDATIAEMARKKIWYVPTIDHNRYYAENGDYLGYVPGSGYKERLNEFIQRNLETARRAFKAGVRFAMGSDGIYSMFGENTRELGWFVKAGMTPSQAIATATRDAAELLQQENSLGRVAAGYYADLVAVEGDPLSDITQIYNVRWVMKGGAVVVDKTKAQF